MKKKMILVCKNDRINPNAKVEHIPHEQTGRCVIIEVIYNDNDKAGKALPKNIRQIGKDTGNRKIYIEDYVYSFIQETLVDEFDDGQVGILLGETVKNGASEYTFIRGAIEVSNASVFSERIAFTEETWPIVNNTKKLYFNGFEMIGWYLCSSKITKENMDVINKADKEYFSQEGNVFYLLDMKADQGTFYRKSEEGLAPEEGYVTYFELNNQMRTYTKELRAPRRQRNYGHSTAGKKKESGDAVSKSVKHHLTLIYSLSVLLVVVVVVIVMNSINNFDKKNHNNQSTTEVAMETTTEKETEPATTAKETKKAEETTTEKETTTAETTTVETTTAEPTKQQSFQTYTVQDGDTLIGICKKYYGSEKMTYVQKIMDFNGLKSTSDILPGMSIKIPDL